MPKSTNDRLVIEQGSRGATYQNDMNTYTVYAIGRYGRGSVLAGQQRRQWMDEFKSLEEAQKAYPTAKFTPNQSSYQEPNLSHLPADGDGYDDGN